MSFLSSGSFWIASLLNFFKKDKALSLFLMNLFLGTIFLLLSDPFLFFQKSYHNAEPFFPYKSSEIERIRIGRKGHEILMERKNGNWSVQIPETTARPDLKKIESLLSAVLKLRKFSKIATHSKNQDFGLNGEELKLEIQTESGEVGKLEIGVSGKQETGTFVRIPENKEIWFVEESLNPLAGRGNETFFLSNSLIPDEMEISEIHTILIEISSKTNPTIQIQQVSPGQWTITNSEQDHCWGEDCGLWVERLFKTKAERILKKPFYETIQNLSSGEKLRINIYSGKNSESVYELEWIGKTSQKEPIFRSGNDSVFYVLDPEFLNRFRERFEWKDSFPDSF
ncbi:DUF4340 domain-containing protein [Leptospira stimsonii]|uniref:DUF4340 domain-containing protein n=1 Tax=Leptospira stimsonii TaxID=2202203 RepID=A0A396Z7J1_9LEPT|nr:DUF4340 domain-containing protein [Leptospira stimsonii]RHX89636.1 hypothetical protein DLM75_11740 [Leptospira stimsonii]